ncbi:MAG: histidine phosphatase family protein [Oleibacter sp.]|nr:histidine phosphatase family protein [Thalassolituus sp.]
MAVDYEYHIKTIDIIRHGEPEGGNVLRGTTDHALTQLGHRQFSARLARHDKSWEQVITSPLQRCYVSAKGVADVMQLPLTVDKLWAEIDYGQWENRPMSELMDESSENFQSLWHDPLNFQAPGGESVAALNERVSYAWQELLQLPARHMLLVTHGGVMRILMYQLLRLDPKAMTQMSIPFAGLLRVKVNLNHPELSSLCLLDGEPLDDV